MRRIALFLLTALVMIIQHYGNAQTQAPIKVQQFPVFPIIQPPLPNGSASPLVIEPLPLVATIPIETPEITSTLVLANSSTEATSATLSLFSADGKTSTHQHVSFRPHEKKEFPLSSLETTANPNERWASVTVEQDPRAMGAVIVTGQVVITDLRASIPAYIDEEFSMPEMEGSSQLAAVTDQAEGPPIIAITNLSPTLQHVSLTCLHGANSPFTSRFNIAAYATTKTMACSDASFSGLATYTSTIEKNPAQGVYGLHVEGDGLPGSLAAFAMAPHFRGHDLVFSSVPFYDPETIHASDVVFAGVPVGAQATLPNGVYIPRLSLANFSDRPLAYSIHLADTVTSPVKDAEEHSHPPLLNLIHADIIPPHQTAEYVFSGQEAQSGLLHSVVVATEGKPGTFQAKLVSRSTGILYQVELLAKESLDMNNGGIHPWTLQGDTESHIVLFNHSKSDKKVGVFINVGPDIMWASEMFLAASETREVSINKLQSERIPDDKGRYLPITAKEGTVDWRTPESGDITGRLMVTSRDAAMARNFSCGNRTAECQFALYTLASDIGVGDVLPMYNAVANYCSFNPNTPLNCSLYSPGSSGVVNYSWNVGATNIITLNTSSDQHLQEPNLKGVSSGMGSAVVTASGGGCTSTGTGYPTVQVPTSMIFLSDLTTKSSACAITSENANYRIIQYQIMDQNGNHTGSVPMQENFQNLSTTTCSNPLPTPTACNSAGVSSQGIFTDFISTNACSPPNAPSCGFSVSPDLWQWCPSGQTATTIGKPSYSVLWQGIYVDGSTATITPSTPVPR
jgi:hypothetical protein